MKIQRLKRLALLQQGRRFAIHEPDGRGVLRDFASDQNLCEGGIMFDGIEVGMVVVVDTFAFPIVGEVVRFSDVSITLKNTVRILYDGRHGEFAKGAKHVPEAAEIERSYPLWTINADFIGGCGPYPGNKIPEPR